MWGVVGCWAGQALRTAGICGVECKNANFNKIMKNEIISVKFGSVIADTYKNKELIK